MPDKKFLASIEVEGVLHQIGIYEVDMEAVYAINAKCVRLGIPMMNPKFGVGPCFKHVEKDPEKSIYQSITMSF